TIQCADTVDADGRHCCLAGLVVAQGAAAAGCGGGHQWCWGWCLLRVRARTTGQAQVPAPLARVFSKSLGSGLVCSSRLGLIVSSRETSNDAVPRNSRRV